MPTTASTFLPLEFVFQPRWWHTHYGIDFSEPFSTDPLAHPAIDQQMQRVLHARYGDIGLGKPDPPLRPYFSSRHIAGGFIVPHLLGCTTRFSAGDAAWTETRHLTPDEIMALEVPDIWATPPMDRIRAGMDALEAAYGYVLGDMNTGGVLNIALDLRGNELFTDLYDRPAMVEHLCRVVADTIVAVASGIKARTGGNGVATNRMTGHVNPGLHLHANCSAQMVSPRAFRQHFLRWEHYLAERLQPYGIHYCGENLHQMAALYAEVEACFFDVGWGSDVALCRAALPDAFFNLRLDPRRMLRCTPDEIAADAEALLRAAGPLEQAGMCCINMDVNTPDDNLFAVAEVVARYRGYGA